MTAIVLVNNADRRVTAYDATLTVQRFAYNTGGGNSKN